MLFRSDRRGGWTVLLIADPRVPESAERLRWIVSSLALPSVGFGPIVLGRIVRLDDDRVQTIDELAFRGETLEQAWDEFVRDAVPPTIPPPR